MLILSWIRTFLTRLKPSIAAAGSILVLIQNLLLLSSLAILVIGRDPIGGDVLTFSLYTDLVGIFLIGLGLLSLALRDSMRSPRGSCSFWTPTRIGFASGILCLMWVFLTIGWRVIGFTVLGNSINAASDMPSESSEFAAAMSSLFANIQILIAAWIAASLSLAIASCLFALYMTKRNGWRTGIVAWPFFCILNALATLFFAFVLLALMGGDVAFPLILTAGALKLVIVPFFGVIAYSSLSRKFVRISRAEREAEKIETEIEASPLTSEMPRHDDNGSS